MPEQSRVALLLAELATARPLISPFVTYSEETAGELAILRTAADIHRRYGKDAVPNYVISKATTVSDVLEVALLLKEVGLLRAARPEARPQHRAAVRDHRRPAQLRQGHGFAACPSPTTHACSTAAAACRR